MQTVTVVAVKDFTLKGRHYRRGDNVTMTAVEAAVEAQNHNVSLLERPRPEMTYERRDMIAEQPVPAPAPSSPVPQKTRRRRRSTNRRDMVAEQ